MKDAVTALAAYTAAQGAVLLNLAITETFETIDVTCPVTDLTQSLTLAPSVVKEGSSVSVVLTDSDESEEITLRSEQPDDWTVNGALDAFYPQLAEREAPDRWTTADLTAQPPVVGFSATATITLKKARWAVPLSEQTGRSVWVGLSTSAFVDWVRRATWTGPLKALFAKPGALILLSDWVGDASRLGARLTVGDLDTRADSPPADPRWPEQVPAERLRVLDVDSDRARPPELRATLTGLIAAAAAWLLGEDRDAERSRPSRRSLTRWEIGKDPSQRLTKAEAIVELARWVERDPNLTRLAIARQIAAARIPDASKAEDASPVLAAADIAYHTAIDESVQKALQSQLELERSFQDLDSKLAELRDTLRTSVDSTIIRTLTASLGIVIAALTVSDARGWPTVLASAAVAAYVLFTAWWSLRTMRDDFTVRLDALEKLIRVRAVGLGDDLGAKIDAWKISLKNRVIAAQIALTILALIVAGGGATLGLTIGRPGTTPSPLVAPACGDWRWFIKTLSDGNAGAVNFKPTKATVSGLGKEQRPERMIQNITPRIWPAEYTTWRVKGVLQAATEEGDRDIHLVIAEPSDRSVTMNVEFPDVECEGAVFSKKRAAMQSAREALMQECGPIPSGSFVHLGGEATITGVGFWDSTHKVTGQSGNHIELHPVLGIRFKDKCQRT